MDPVCAPGRTGAAPAGRGHERCWASGYAAGVTEQTQHQSGAPSGQALTTARDFVAQHGTPAKAVIENLGRVGTRVVLVGADGALGDVVVPGRDVAEALIEATEDLHKATWDADTVNATVIGSAHRRKMAGLRQRG